MTPIDWPAALPCPRWEPYRVAPRPGAIQMDIGILSPRARIYTMNNEVVSVELVLNATQEQAFRTFYKTTLGMGTQWFNADIQRNGTLEPAELLFIGAPPVFTPVANNVVRSAFTLLTRGEPLPEAVYELTATQAVNIDAETFKLALNSSGDPGGTVVTIAALATDKLIITKPTIAADPALTWDAWSPYNSDGAHGGLSYTNWFVLSDQSNALLLNYFPSAYGATAAAAQTITAADFPMQFTGSTSYKFWSYDTPITDNRFGLSLRVETYSLVP